MTTFLVFHMGETEDYDRYFDTYQVEAPTPLDAVRQAHKRTGTHGEYYVAPKSEVVRIDTRPQTEPLFEVTTAAVMGEVIRPTPPKKKPASKKSTRRR